MEALNGPLETTGTHVMNYRGWMFIGFSSEYPTGKIAERTFMGEPCLAFRGQSGALHLVEPYCSHFGVHMATGKVVQDLIQCPMHGRTFRGDGSCAKPRQRAIRSYPVHEDRGLAYAWFDQAGVEPGWSPPRFLDDEHFPHILWRHSRELELHHPSVPLDNSVDPRHFRTTHAMFGKVVEDGVFEPDGHEATGTMATEILPPLSMVTGGAAEVTTWFDGPLNTSLQTKVGPKLTHLCNFLTIVEGRHCRLTQIGIGRRSLNPLRWFENGLGFAGSWYATYEDAPVWNNRKVQPADSDPHQTDVALEAFRTWFEGFAYEPERPEHAAARLSG